LRLNSWVTFSPYCTIPTWNINNLCLMHLAKFLVKFSWV
jgi:hypothetical protein